MSNQQHWKNLAQQSILEQNPSIIDDGLVQLQHDVIQYLSKDKSFPKISKEQIKRDTKIDLDVRYDLLESLKKNTYVVYEEVNRIPTFRYQPKYPVKSKNEIANVLKGHESGIELKDLKDNYDEIESDIKSLALQGIIIGLPEDKSRNDIKTLFYRGDHYLTPLSGLFSVEQGSLFIEGTENTSAEIRHGDFNYQPAKTPFSVASDSAISKSIDEQKRKGGWVYPLEPFRIYLDHSYEGKTDKGIIVYREGVSNDIRDLWFNQNDNDIPCDGDEIEKKCKEAGLSPNALFQDKKPIKRRNADGKQGAKKQRKIRRLVNDHIPELANKIMSEQ
ncbi:hypothetical protein WA158_003429 [Blastocystis sp. Blastoise]